MSRLSSGKPTSPRYPNYGTNSDFMKWDGTRAIIRIYEYADKKTVDPTNDPSVFISYDIHTKETARVDN